MVYDDLCDHVIILMFVLIFEDDVRLRNSKCVKRINKFSFTSHLRPAR